MRVALQYTLIIRESRCAVKHRRYQDLSWPAQGLKIRLRQRWHHGRYLGYNGANEKNGGNRYGKNESNRRVKGARDK